MTLDADSQETLDSLRGELERGEAQLRGENWDRMVITADVPIEGDESVALVNALRSLADGRYGEGACLVIGDVTSAKELADSLGVEMPICEAMYDVLYNGAEVRGMVHRLMSRAPKRETDNGWV